MVEGSKLGPIQLPVRVKLFSWQFKVWVKSAISILATIFSLHFEPFGFCGTLCFGNFKMSLNFTDRNVFNFVEIFNRTSLLLFIDRNLLSLKAKIKAVFYFVALEDKHNKNVVKMITCNKSTYVFRSYYSLLPSKVIHNLMHQW